MERPAEASGATRAARPAIDDPLYDQLLQKYTAVRGGAPYRRYLTAQVLAAAAAYRVDPDLLFALIAAESRFNTRAVSPKGARGLGQMQFRTAHAVAPHVVRRPEDLHDPRRNLDVTARHLRQLLDERDGDLRAALRAYRGGAFHEKGIRYRAYVSRVAAYYRSMKAWRNQQDRAEVDGGKAPATGQ